MIQISFSIGRGRGRGRGRRRLSGGVKEESRREGEGKRGREEERKRAISVWVGLDRKAQSNQRGGRGFELYVTHTCTHAHTQSVGENYCRRRPIERRQ
jgi:hypothetical protein